MPRLKAASASKPALPRAELTAGDVRKDEEGSKRWRNRKRFPDDLLLQLTDQEWIALRSQFVTSKPELGGHRYRPYVFTEQGVAMLFDPRQ